MCDQIWLVPAWVGRGREQKVPEITAIAEPPRGSTRLSVWFVSLTSSQYPVGWQLLAWLCPALLLSADWRERRTQNGSWGGFSKTTGVCEQISTCAIFCEPAERVNTHQLSGLWFCPLQVLTVNPRGGKVNKSPFDNTARTVCNQCHKLFLSCSHSSHDARYWQQS